MTSVFVISTESLLKREELKKFYEADDEDPYIHFFAMREKLKADGIDVEAIRNDLMKEAGIE